MVVQSHVCICLRQENDLSASALLFGGTAFAILPQIFTQREHLLVINYLKKFSARQNTPPPPLYKFWISHWSKCIESADFEQTTWLLQFCDYPSFAKRRARNQSGLTQLCTDFGDWVATLSHSQTWLVQFRTSPHCIRGQLSALPSNNVWILLRVHPILPAWLFHLLWGVIMRQINGRYILGLMKSLEPEWANPTMYQHWKLGSYIYKPLQYLA